MYRVGGDEFIALGKRKSIEEANQFINKIRNALANTEYMCSFGCAIYNVNDNFTEKCSEADVKMYEDKKKYKHR